MFILDQLLCSDPKTLGKGEVREHAKFKFYVCR